MKRRRLLWEVRLVRAREGSSLRSLPACPSTSHRSPGPRGAPAFTAGPSLPLLWAEGWGPTFSDTPYPCQPSFQGWGCISGGAVTWSFLETKKWQSSEPAQPQACYQDVLHH